MQHDFNVQKVTWQTHAAQLKAVREQVFIIEQQVPIDLELDGLDATAQHLLALTDVGEAIGCARLLGDGSIGRMAVLKHSRGSGVGAALLNVAVAQHLQQGVQTITLSAQMHAIHFYEKAGFEVCSVPYLDAGILHVDMQLVR
ncbi:MAG: GNAT family N-acetyltransferase [Methylotenera sp.]|nr:GNAT family N-acetyltransferase [Methylotenera sp.]MDD4926334.1 GNAT family N-acetyltransferase [Methylotenera sp.]NOS96602.1 GNAT family N-acetyltransferase [Methylotenera sp.]